MSKEGQNTVGEVRTLIENVQKMSKMINVPQEQIMDAMKLSTSIKANALRAEQNEILADIWKHLITKD